MKNEQLKKLIKEEIKKILEIDTPEMDTTEVAPNNPSNEKISGGEFNADLLQLLVNLRKDKSGLAGTELKNLMDIFKLIVRYSKDLNLSQPVEDKIRRIIDPRGNIQNTIDNPVD